MDDDFYITLTTPPASFSCPITTGSLDKNNSNSSNFKVDLSYRHDLSDGEKGWEIGLVEIHFTALWPFETPAFDMVVWYSEFDTVRGLYRARRKKYYFGAVENSLLGIPEVGLPVRQVITSFVQVPANTWENVEEFGKALAKLIENTLNNSLRSLLWKTIEKTKASFLDAPAATYTMESSIANTRKC